MISKPICSTSDFWKSQHISTMIAQPKDAPLTFRFSRFPVDANRVELTTTQPQLDQPPLRSVASDGGSRACSALLAQLRLTEMMGFKFWVKKTQEKDKKTRGQKRRLFATVHLSKFLRLRCLNLQRIWMVIKHDKPLIVIDGFRVLFRVSHQSSD